MDKNIPADIQQDADKYYHNPSLVGKWLKDAYIEGRIKERTLAQSENDNLVVEVLEWMLKNDVSPFHSETSEGVSAKWQYYSSESDDCEFCNSQQLFTQFKKSKEK